MKRIFIFIFVWFALMGLQMGFAKGVGFTQEDRDRLIRLEATLQTFMEQTNKRFEDMNRRFEELREDMNKRFEQVDKRFEEVDKRFEQVDKRFEEQLQLFKWIAGVFTAMVIGFVGLLIWDRRTATRGAIMEYEKELDRKFRISDLPRLIEALKEKAKRDEELAAILRNFHLF